MVMPRASLLERVDDAPDRFICVCILEGIVSQQWHVYGLAKGMLRQRGQP